MNINNTIQIITGLSAGFFLSPLFFAANTKICIKLFGDIEFQRIVANDPFSQISRPIKVLLAPFVCVVAPIAEELVFRFATQMILKELFKTDNSRLGRMLATAKSITLTSILFGLFHFSNVLLFETHPKIFVPQVIYTTLLGVILGIFQELGGLSSPIGIHIGCNMRAWYILSMNR